MEERRIIEESLSRLVSGFESLRHDGGFVEPNLDGTPGDYISFDGWEWPQGVGLYGLVQLWLARDRDKDLGAMLTGWYDRAMARGLPGMNVNTTAPMLALSILWRETRDPRHEAVLDDWANRVMSDAPRTPFGGIQHDVSDKVNSGELWDDTLFMVALFLASYGQAARRPDLVDEAVKQFLVHAQFLADRETGLWFHGWTFEGRHNFARARWARGNAWITACLLDLFDLATIPEAPACFLRDLLRDQVKALLPLQTDEGAWRTLLDDPGSYPETSATAGFAYGLMKGARLGLLGYQAGQAGRRAVDYVIRQIGPEGVVGGVSYGTRMGHDLQFYRDIPIQPTGYGQSLVILALAEALKQTE
ncbi:glycoside hydrolase family 88/105 protein [Paracoccus aerodenitrificans]|uniref:beta-galactosidase BglB n=1 Tax=Paracoccus aerodenitrificans TaxID=3017781 RepID=UPI0022F01EB6|nr:glycoside hydrolase family 88 protein [Paracoccus aerodenitrificans]WBU65455.1 glycoside hydrolase family 88 protein [Paracoccus aerodenitrificans]